MLLTAGTTLIHSGMMDEPVCGVISTINPVIHGILAEKFMTNQQIGKIVNLMVKKSRGTPSANEAESVSLSTEQMHQLLKLLKSNSASGTPSISLAQTSSNPNAIS